MEQLKSGENNVLIASDVASRGLGKIKSIFIVNNNYNFINDIIVDLKDIRYVINYEFPRDITDYVHRIGRTGRAGIKGTAIAYFSEENRFQVDDLINLLKESKHKVDNSLFQISKIKNSSRRELDKLDGS